MASGTAFAEIEHKYVDAQRRMPMLPPATRRQFHGVKCRSPS
jgi:hypothetical protein